jgi:hypothetical protein
MGTHIIAARAEKRRGFGGSAELGDVGFNAEVTESGTRRFGEAEQDGHLKAAATRARAQPRMAVPPRKKE